MSFYHYFCVNFLYQPQPAAQKAPPRPVSPAIFNLFFFFLLIFIRENLVQNQTRPHKTKNMKTPLSKVSRSPTIWFGSYSFFLDMLEVFDLFNELMKNTTPQMRGPQSSALKNISSIFGDLEKIFTRKELSSIISRFIQSVQYSPQLELLNKEKLILLNKLVCNSSLFLDKGMRLPLL